jgi:hypothetical protein
LSSVEQKSYEKLHFGDENVIKNGQEKKQIRPTRLALPIGLGKHKSF